MFPPLKHSGRGRQNPCSLYSIGYDRFSQTYKIVVVSFFKDDNTNQVHVYTLGTDSWKRIGDLPNSSCIDNPGVFASGTINWLAKDSRSSIVISLDFEKESYQKLSHPNVETNCWTLGVLKDCLSIFAYTNMFVDVWIMNECGNNQPWTKLYHVPYMVYRGNRPYCTPLYITEDDQVLMYFHDHSTHTNLVVYDSKIGTYNMPELQNIDHWRDSVVYVESLISPCS
ncbi:putative kelch-type beta propeller, F-box associated interaction domain-containing protein [Medicago truncatula]|nr:F-box protein CPR1 [Medicago truncatula]RHN66455.1 putative kelch-type beta propeller, F-box associated interaction domain-containing protein [Medicago truncatula]